MTHTEAFKNFCRANRKEIQTKNLLSKSEVTERLEYIWLEMTDRQKTPYFDKDFKCKEDSSSDLAHSKEIGSIQELNDQKTKILDERKNHDPPKKAINGYNFFTSYYGMKLKDCNLGQHEKIKVIAQQWNLLSQDYKDFFQTLFQEDKLRFQQETTNKSLGKTESSGAKIVRIQQKQSKINFKIQPKRPVSSFMQFARDNTKKVMQQEKCSLGEA